MSTTVIVLCRKLLCAALVIVCDNGLAGGVSFGLIAITGDTIALSTEVGDAIALSRVMLGLLVSTPSSEGTARVCAGDGGVAVGVAVGANTVRVMTVETKMEDMVVEVLLVAVT